MFAFSELGRPRVLSFPERLVQSLSNHTIERKADARIKYYGPLSFNSSPASAAYMHQRIGSALVQIMAWRRIGAKPLSKPMLVYCQLDLMEQTSVKF